MAERASTSAPTAGVAQRGVLLATKLRLPSTRPGFVPRARLLQRLTDGLAGELTLVSAPAGFGKTALLADWARGSPRPVAWLSLDAATTIRRGSGAMSPRPWTRCAPGSLSSSAHCWTRHHNRSKRW